MVAELGTSVETVLDDVRAGGTPVEVPADPAFRLGTPPSPRREPVVPGTTINGAFKLLRTLLEDVIIHVGRVAKRAELTPRWRGGTLTELTVALPRQAPPKIRTSEDTVEFV